MLSEINFLNGYPKIFILGNGGYSKAVQQAVKDLNLDYTLVTRDNWDTIGDIRNSVVYNCTPISVNINKYNTYINSDVKSETGLRLATLQASKQFELYTGLDFPLGD
jgi:shikimate 5-dehydrogenase